MASSLESAVNEGVTAIKHVADNPDVIKKLYAEQGLFQQIVGDLQFENASRPNYKAEALTRLAETLPTIARATNEALNESLGENAVSSGEIQGAINVAAHEANDAILQRAEEVLSGYGRGMNEGGSYGDRDPYIQQRQEDSLRNQAGELGELTNRVEKAEQNVGIEPKSADHVKNAEALGGFNDSVTTEILGTLPSPTFPKTAAVADKGPAVG